MNKVFALAIVAILASTLITFEYTFAQTIPKPAVPEFTVEYVVYTSYIEPTYTVNPYTGYDDTNGNHIDLYFNFRYKGHYETQWTYEPFNPDGKSAYAAGGWAFGSFPKYTQSSSDYTTLTFNLHKFIGYSSGFPSGGQLDFQMQAQIGNIFPSEGVSPSLGSYYNFTGQTSDWSNTKTITIDQSSALPSPSPTVPELSWLAILQMLLSIFFVAVLVRHQKTDMSRNIDNTTQKVCTISEN